MSGEMSSETGPETNADKYPCPCCGYLVFDAPPGSEDICLICFWEDDAAQLRFPDLGGGTNWVPLSEAQRNFAQFGAIEERFANDVRPVRPDDEREPGFRAISPNDSFEIPGTDAAGPDDPTALYYWRPTFWRQSVMQH
jgi:hypothetical protein